MLAVSRHVLGAILRSNKVLPGRNRRSGRRGGSRLTSNKRQKAILLCGN